MFAKIDLSNGFWRMLVQESDKWNFAYALPPGTSGEPIQKYGLSAVTVRLQVNGSFQESLMNFFMVITLL